MLVVYSNICTPCRFKRQLNYVKRIAIERGKEFKLVEVKYRPDLMKEAMNISNLALPFVYDTDRDWSYPLSTIEGGLKK